ncbi:MFS family permease [Alkalihalobacillus xiaoxiensis]|uniref:MFS family permease n=1 Tax=Shouchella xiaoxiensis TaxID=766895 RepID=A0ABS2SP64_9BACI|nr:MFS family permease [Shouchella xiaoxiensis]
MTEEQKRKRATYHLWTFGLSKLIASFGGSVYVFGISLYILTLTGSAMSFAINLICTILPRTLLAPFAGYIADRYSKKAIVVTAQGFSVLIVSGLLLYSLQIGLSLGIIYLATVLLTISSTFTSLTFTASITGLVDPPRIQRASAINQMTISLSSIGGPVLGGILFAFAPFEWFLLIFIAGFAVAVLLEATMNFKLFLKENQELGDIPESMKQSMLSGFRYIKANPAIGRVITMGLFVNFFFGALIVGMPYVIVELLQIESQHFGIIEAFLAGGMLLGGLFFSIHKQLKFPLNSARNGLLLVSLVLAMFTVPLLFQMSYMSMVFFYSAITLSLGVCMSFINTPLGVMMQQLVEDGYKGRVFGVMETVAQALVPLSILLFGMLFEWVGAIAVLLPSSVGLFIITLIMLRRKVLAIIHPEILKGEDEIMKEVSL